MQTKICRWGILGAAEIARKNWQAIRNASNCPPGFPAMFSRSIAGRGGEAVIPTDFSAELFFADGVSA